MNKNSCVVLFSGGLDSTTALHWAKDNFYQVLAISFDYSQKHVIELKMAQSTAKKLDIPLKQIIFPFTDIISSALIDRDIPIPESLDNIKYRLRPTPTYVPFRNGIFLSIAAAFAESRRIYNLITGFNIIDTHDYPDTSSDFTNKMQEAINEGTQGPKSNKFFIHTPLLTKTKSEIIKLGLRLNVDYSYTVSCYRGREIPCLRCRSCHIRNNAFKQLKMEDPLITRLKGENRI